MDTPTLTLAGLVLIPVAILMLLRINAALVFLSLCLGNVLVQFVAKDTITYLTLHSNQLPAQAANANDSTVKLILLLLPVLLTTIFMIRTVNGRSHLILNALPAIGVGILGALLVVPLLSPGLAHNIVASSLWSDIKKSQDVIVGASALVCLIVLWLERPKTGLKKGKHHKG